MIRLIYGPYGSGKTTAILENIAKDTAAGIHTFFIVPEQESVQSERATLEKLSPSAQLHLEVLNFSRLYNRVCREYGGLSYRYVTSPVRHLLMWQNLKELAPLLEQYTDASPKDASLVELMLSARNECKASGVTPEELENTAKRLPTDDPLAKRLRDLSLIFSSFDRLVSEQYTDSADDLSRLYDLLKTKDFFADCNVYVDSFSSFTAVEHKILERIMAQAKNVTVSIPLRHPQHKDVSTLGIQESHRRLLAAAQRHGGSEALILEENHRALHPALRHLSDQLWNMNSSTRYEGPVGESIRMEQCDNLYGEAEAVSAHILELLRRGERCRDIVVLTRSPEHYRGILEPALEKNGIPYFFSQKTDLSTLPAVKLLLSALRIKQYHWQRSDVISHVKTGMLGLSSRSVDLFEEYVETWNISGSRFTDGDWTMNPDGFTEEISPRGQSILTAANEVRRSLTESLERLFILMDAADTVPQLCQAVYRYFEDLSLEKSLFQLAQAEWSRGNRKEARILQDLYSVLLSTLADIATALPEESVTTEEFSLILKTVFQQTDIGSIPTSVDEVVVGSAALLRPFNPKYVFLLGLCEGEFPAAVMDAGIFSRGDRATLSQLGMDLSSDHNVQASDELMYVHRAVSAPSHGLYLFTPSSDMNGKAKSPSLPFHRVLALFSDLKPHRYEGWDLSYSVGSPRSAAAYLRSLEGTAQGESLRAALKDVLPLADSLSRAPTSQTECQLSEQTARSLLQNSVRFSFSRFDSYVRCPFQYYCTYVLGLREKKQASFRVSDIGSFVHYILEHLIRGALTEGEDGSLPDDETLIQMTEQAVEAYVDRICPTELKSSKRLHHLYNRLKRLSLLMVRNIVEEFSHSRFHPAFFELKTNGRNGNPSPLEFELEDGCRVSFSGVIDRVDLWKKEDCVYVRVVDYKTGNTTFSLDDVANGINLQMLLYLFTLCRNQNREFKKSLGVSSEQAVAPAGVLYLSANVQTVQAETFKTEEEILATASNSLKRSGLLLNDHELLRAMNDQLSPQFLAGIKENKDGTSLVGNALCSEDTFHTLYNQMEETIKKITAQMRGGRADASPNPHLESNPCAYCRMKPICRRTD